MAPSKPRLPPGPPQVLVASRGLQFQRTEQLAETRINSLIGETGKKTGQKTF